MQEKVKKWLVGLLNINVQVKKKRKSWAHDRKWVIKHAGFSESNFLKVFLKENICL